MFGRRSRGHVEATRYPTDFDGYIVGDPFFDVPGQILAGRAARALLDAPDSYIPPALLTLVDDAVYASCDAADGLKDNLIQNPGTCAFNPEGLPCGGGNTVNCLTQNQVNTLSAWFSAAKDEQVRVVSLGFPVSDVYNNGAAGNNLFRWTEAAGPPRDINSADPWGQATTEQAAGWAFYDQSFKYLVYLDPTFDNNHHAAVDRRGVVNGVSLARLEARTQAGRGRMLGFFAQPLETVHEGDHTCSGAIGTRSHSSMISYIYILMAAGPLLNS